jgi:hypothetical protein
MRFDKNRDYLDDLPTEVRDIAPGLWIWRHEHSHWKPGLGTARGFDVRRVGGRAAGSRSAGSAGRGGGGVEAARCSASDRGGRPQAGSRSGRRCVRAPVWGSGVRSAPVFRYDVPETELEWIQPGSQLPGGLVALYDGRDRSETPLWLPEQRALVFADALTAPGGDLRVWATPWHEERALPALRKLLELPFEHVIVSHGEPVHTRAAYERALEVTPWSG